MPAKRDPQSKESIAKETTRQASRLWGARRAQLLQSTIVEHAAHMEKIYERLPYFEETPTFMWHNHP
ncbi:MAG: hypothetical protein FJ320_12045 [SAR202 cluster bacterium]|nr:hypothetical protein [SAR202 cluster bacterium]